MENDGRWEKKKRVRQTEGGEVVGGEIQIVKSALPVRGVTICAGKLVRKSMLSARNPTDRRAHTHAHTYTPQRSRESGGR